MKKMLSIVLTLMAILAFAGCGSVATNNKVASSEKPAAVATNPVNGQSEQKASNASGAVYATRKIEGGTPITLTIGNTVIPATLNDSKSSKDLISRLPYTVKLRRFAHDYCGVMKEPLAYDKKDVHNGWMNGDIDFATDGNYFTILYKDEDISQQFGYQVNLGVINAPLSVMDTLGEDITIKIELAKL